MSHPDGKAQPLVRPRNPTREAATHESLPLTEPLFACDDEFDGRRTTSVTAPAPSEDYRHPCFSVLAGPQAGQVFKLLEGPHQTIGRAPECDIALNDDGVSRLHATVRRVGGRVMIEDLNSRNGTYVGSERVTQREICSDDLLRIGASTILKFSWMADSEQALQSRLKEATLRDALTGSYNRRHFDECLESEQAANTRHPRPLALLMIDIDDFKATNDTYGHQTGDLVLRHVAQEIMSCARREDLVFRYGGEEFALLARDTDAQGATRLANRVCESVRNLRLQPEGGAVLRTTVSVGVAQLQSDLQRLLKDADSALYQAKQSGKDRAIRFQSPADTAPS